VECGEAERPFKLMSGGRFIFTNLRDTDAFPKRRSPIPDVRLPYEIVQGPNVSLAKAAALNANFPPVFPKCKRLDSLPGHVGLELQFLRLYSARFGRLNFGLNSRLGKEGVGLSRRQRN
jgi:hypothetical protein